MTEANTPLQGTYRKQRTAIDAYGIKQRTAAFCSRSIKKNAKLDTIKLAISMTDLTTLEGADTEAKVKQLCAKAAYPIRSEIIKNQSQLFAVMQNKENFTLNQPLPSCAAVCVYPNFVKTAKKALHGSSIKVASVATGFPSGQIPLDFKEQETAQAIKDGADEIDMVINRGAFLSGNYDQVFHEIAQIKKICGDKTHLKVILETGELQSLEKIRLASDIAMDAGADFIKTSTGKIQPAATMEVTLVMLHAISDYYEKTGKKIGMKPAGGIRGCKQAIQYLVMVYETLGQEWLSPELFRFGASSLLNDLLRQYFKQITGYYFYNDLFSDD